MREEGISSSGDPLLFRNSSPRPPTPAASSAGASSPAVATNAGSTDWLGHGQGQGQGSKVGSLSRIGSQPMWISLSASACGSVLGSSQPSCRPWERGDLLRRLSTFKPANWFGKPKAASSLACARRGWVNVDIDKIECESCGATLKYVAPDSWTPTEGENLGEEFANQLDEGHKVICPWRGNSCAESLVQFPPTPPSALIGGYKDRCDGLFQFLYLPIVASSTLDEMRVSRGPEIDRFLVQSYTFTPGESGCKADIASGSENNKEDTLCIYSRAQKLISLCGWEPIWVPNVQDCEEHSAQSARNGCSFKTPLVGPTPTSRSPLLDCSLCGATVRIFDFLTITRPSRFTPNTTDVPETSKKMTLTRGVSAASGINGWVADLDDVAATGEVKSMSNIGGVDLDLTMGGGFSTKTVISQQYQDPNNIGKDLAIGQPAGSEVGDRAASYESRGPSTRKRNLDEGGSTVDRPPHVAMQADSVEGVVIDRDGDEVNDSKHKRVRESNVGPSQVIMYFDGPHHQQQQNVGNSTRASSVIAMDMVYQNEDNDSMESVENHPGNIDIDIDIDNEGVSFNFKSPDLNENNNYSDLNLSNNQVQQSTCVGMVRGQGVSSTNDDDEVLNIDNENRGREVDGGVSFGISGGSVGMGASHEAEIHGGVDASVHNRAESVVGDMEPVAEVTENQGQNGEFAADFVPEENEMEQMSRADSGSKVVGSTKAESVESGENQKTTSKDEVTQAGKSSPTDECGFTNGIGPPNGESNFEEGVEFDPIKHHNFFCPWVNGNVAAAGNLLLLFTRMIVKYLVESSWGDTLIVETMVKIEIIANSVQESLRTALFMKAVVV
ncbi:unnamed protein product [Lactuca virosa]|uniref:C3HC-type domain-containing protein n=1 Tax=Lactuca virosa TaxID=75947 RepID=A0AAU9P3T1_9ASTR|nr:unnamed protein product [Lactuca virosa]